MTNTSTERTDAISVVDPEATVGIDLDSFRNVADVEVTMSAELDRRTISVRELLRWRVGQVVLLNRPTGENVDLFAGDVLIGNAEILIVDDRLAVRVADLRDKAPVIHAPVVPQS